MATYVMLFGFTEQGIKNIKDSPARVRAAKKAFQAIGAKVKQFYAVMGMAPYDTLFILEAPDDKTEPRQLPSIVSLGYVHTQTVRAFTEEEFRNIVADLP